MASVFNQITAKKNFYLKYTYFSVIIFFCHTINNLFTKKFFQHNCYIHLGLIYKKDFFRVVTYNYIHYIHLYYYCTYFLLGEKDNIFFWGKIILEEVFWAWKFKITSFFLCLMKYNNISIIYGGFSSKRYLKYPLTKIEFFA